MNLHFHHKCPGYFSVILEILSMPHLEVQGMRFVHINLPHRSGLHLAEISQEYPRIAKPVVNHLPAYALNGGPTRNKPSRFLSLATNCWILRKLVVRPLARRMSMILSDFPSTFGGVQNTPWMQMNRGCKPREYGSIWKLNLHNFPPRVLPLNFHMLCNHHSKEPYVHVALALVYSLSWPKVPSWPSQIQKFGSRFRHCFLIERAAKLPLWSREPSLLDICQIFSGNFQDIFRPELLHGWDLPIQGITLKDGEEPSRFFAREAVPALEVVHDIQIPGI